MKEDKEKNGRREEDGREFIALMIRIWHCCQFPSVVGLICFIREAQRVQGKRATGRFQNLPQVSLLQDSWLDDIISSCLVPTI